MPLTHPSRRLHPPAQIRHWGLSNETCYGVAMHCAAADRQGVPRPLTIQNCFNLLHRTFESELAEACAPPNFNMGLLPWSALAGVLRRGCVCGEGAVCVGPLHSTSCAAPRQQPPPPTPTLTRAPHTPRTHTGGALTGKYLAGAAPAGSRFDLFAERYARFNTPRVAAAVQQYARIAGEAGLTPAQLGYAFCRSRWFIPTTIIGATSMAQLRENLGAFGAAGMLSPETLAAMDAVHVQQRNPALMD